MHIHRTLYYPIRPQERIHDNGHWWSHDNDDMMKFVQIKYILHSFILYRTYFLMVTNSTKRVCDFEHRIFNESVEINLLK